MPIRSPSHRSARKQAGLSLIELMIGIAVCLFLVAGASTLFVHHLDSNRRLMLTARVHQDLRVASDLISRDVRRAGYWPSALKSTAKGAAVNPYGVTTPVGSTPATTVSYSYGSDDNSSSTPALGETFGIRLSGNSLQMRDGDGGWQQITDPGTVIVTRLSVTPEIESVSLGHLCYPACTNDNPACPRLNRRQLHLLIQGRATHDSGVTREVRESVRVRNDEVPVVSCP